MIQPQYILPLARELVIDLFAGGGGASCGIELAIGRHVDVAVNHSRPAVAQHYANHPQTKHYCEDVFEVDPLEVTAGQPVGLLWASPDCKHFSKAKGGKPVSKKIRGLAGVVIKWCKALGGRKPRVICLENVEEFQTWGPLGEDGRPCPERKGLSFRRWVKGLQNLGYVVEWRELRACDYGAPTIRKRLFLVARCDGQPIVWPEASHAKVKTKGKKPWRTAAECIDWSIPCPSIFLSKEEGQAVGAKRPLADATMRRIAHGVKRYVLDCAKPFIVPVTHQGDARVHSIDDPLRTITSAKRGEFALAVPTLIQTGYGERPGQTPRVPGLEKPLGTCVDGQKHAVVAAFLAQHNTGMVGHHMEEPVSTIVGKGCTQALVSATLTGVGGRTGQGQSPSYGVDRPLRTITAKADTALVTSNLVKLRGTSSSAGTGEPLHLVSAQGTHHAEVRALLLKYYGTEQDPRLDEPLHTITTKPRFAVVTVEGSDYYIADIGMRMLKPRELYRAQGFPDTYVIDHGIDIETGKRVTLTQEQQVRGVGNSVSPMLARAIVSANFIESSSISLRSAA
jgi:DNA (cytosine-5)-methyltransferase 1